MIAAFLASLPAPRAAATPHYPCARPFVVPHLTKPSTFDIPPDAVPQGAYRDVRILVSLDARGRVTHAKVAEPSGSPKFDAASLKAAATSSYGPKIAKCAAVPSTYFYIVQFGSPPPVRAK